MQRFLEASLVSLSLIFFIFGSCVSCVNNRSVTNQTIRFALAPETAEQTQYYPHVVRLSSIAGPVKIQQFSGSFATGFAVDKHHILTAGHYCGNIAQLYLASLVKDRILVEGAHADGRLYKVGEAEIVDASDKADLCLLRLENHNIIPAVLAPTTNIVQTEDEVIVVGGPLSVFPVRRTGNVISLRAGGRFGGWPNLMLLAIDVQPGNSGGPVFWNGKVVGVVVLSSQALHSAALAEKIETVHEFLDKHLK